MDKGQLINNAQLIQLMPWYSDVLSHELQGTVFEAVVRDGIKERFTGAGLDHCCLVAARTGEVLCVAEGAHGEVAATGTDHG